MRIQKKVSNPNLLIDINKYLGLDLNQEDLDTLGKVKSTALNNLTNLVDRMEFIDHLNTLRMHVQDMGFEINSQEVVGCDDDIRALRVYLALTCIDLFSSSQPFTDWLVENVNDFYKNGDAPDFGIYLQEKIKVYERSKSVGFSFRNVIIDASKETQKDLVEHLTVYEGNKSCSSDIEDIASFLYQIRNAYTHNGFRVNFDERLSQLPIEQRVQIKETSPKYMVVASGVDLVGLILNVVKGQAVRDVYHYLHRPQGNGELSL